MSDGTVTVRLFETSSRLTRSAIVVDYVSGNHVNLTTTSFRWLSESEEKKKEVILKIQTLNYSLTRTSQAKILMFFCCCCVKEKNNT